MKNLLTLLIAGILGSQVAFADDWDAEGKILLSRLGNVQGKPIINKRRYEFGVTNTAEFKRTVTVFDQKNGDEGRKSCNIYLAGNVEVPGVLENLYLDAHVTLLLDTISYDYDRISISMKTQTGTELMLRCQATGQSRFTTLKDLELLLRPYFDISSLLPKPPSDRQIKDFEWGSDDRYL